MKKSFKKLIGAMLSMTMLVTGVVSVNLSQASSVMAAPIAVTESSGWFESCYLEWAGGDASYTGYNAYVKKSSDSSWTQLDDLLIRKYADHWRADAVGLAAGSYDMKVVPYTASGEVSADAIEATNLDVTSYDRSGAAFSSKSNYGESAGAYNSDGTPKSGAKIIYVTPETAKTVTASIKQDKSEKEFTGFQAIMNALQKGTETAPVIVRIVGMIDDSDMDDLLSNEGLQVKGKNAYSNLNLTIEGIGEDAGIKGFGMLLRNAGNVELRNFAVLDCMDDCISVDTNNSDLWIHNLDLYYGQVGSDSDQAKGDGTVDIKGKSTFVTVSYNHFYDSGKSSLCGMTSEVNSSHITYHHNWFDHSDSRHPRIRTMSVHIYNNYYDGNAKYGVGTTLGSSAFVESNYFRNCKHPMLMSLQGSDIMANEKTGAPDFSASGTFSKDAGGVIKAYNNHIEGSDKNELAVQNGDTTAVEPVYYNAADTAANGAATQFDAYLASSRSEKVPSTVKTVSGGNTYNNFDTDTANFDLGVDEADITPVEDVPKVVMASAGRMNGGDLPWTFTSADDTDYSVNTALRAAVTGYTSSIASFGGRTDGEIVTTTSTESTTEATTSSTPATDATTETTTSSIASTPVELSEPVTSAATGSNYVTYNNGSYTLVDTSAEKTELSLPLSTAVSSGKVVVSGTASPSVEAGKWAFVQVRGLDSTGAKVELASLATDNNKNITLRTDGDANKYASSSVKVSANTVYNYQFVIDLDSKSVELTVNGQTYTGEFTKATDIVDVYAVTAGSASRNVTISTPYVGVVGEVTTEATTAATTEATTAATTEPTTAATTEPTTAATTEPTTGSTPVAESVYGDANANGDVDSGDAADILQKVLTNAKTKLEDVKDDFMAYLDVDKDGVLTSRDAAYVLQKALDKSFIMPIEAKG